MSDSAARMPPSFGILAAPAPRNRATRPPVCPPAATRRRQPLSPSPCWPRFPPHVRGMTPLLTSENRRRSPTARTNMLLKRIRLA